MVKKGLPIANVAPLKLFSRPPTLSIAQPSYLTPLAAVYRDADLLSGVVSTTNCA